MTQTKSYPVPSNEVARLAELKSLNVLDTVREKLFDDLTKLASVVCDTEIGAISLIDDKRQWFKSSVGLSVSETPRDIAFCAHAIYQATPMVIEDATQDDRFKANPLVTDGPKIRFYAGTPLVTTAGQAIGTLCVIDQVKRQISPEQTYGLQVIARCIVMILEWRRAQAAFQAVENKGEGTPEWGVFASQMNKLWSGLERSAENLDIITFSHDSAGPFVKAIKAQIKENQGLIKLKAA